MSISHYNINQMGREQDASQEVDAMCEDWGMEGLRARRASQAQRSFARRLRESGICFDRHRTRNNHVAAYRLAIAEMAVESTV